MRGFWVLAVLGVYCFQLSAADEASRWQVREVSDLRPLNRIFFLDEHVGWMLGGTNSILKTVDGGVTWIVLKTNLSDRRTGIGGLWFRDENRGWAVGEVRQEPTIWETTDGGSSWTVRYSEPRVATGAMLDIRFVDEMYGWAVGYNSWKAMIKVTFDGGKHWITQYSGGEITNQFNLVRFWDSMHGWVLGPGAVMRTSDGGESWELQYFDDHGSQLNDLDLVGPSEAWIAGDRGQLLHIQDGRNSEVPVTGTVGATFIGWVRFATKDSGWAWGVNGEIVKTTDGGKTWTREASPLKIEPNSEISTGDGATNGSNLFITVTPGRLLVHATR
jgi:photosystem II stability/assembly factor-like uncharacterized protein